MDHARVTTHGTILNVFLNRAGGRINRHNNVFTTTVTQVALLFVHDDDNNNPGTSCNTTRVAQKTNRTASTKPDHFVFRVTDQCPLSNC